MCFLVDAAPRCEFIKEWYRIPVSKVQIHDRLLEQVQNERVPQWSALIHFDLHSVYQNRSPRIQTGTGSASLRNVLSFVFEEKLEFTLRGFKVALRAPPSPSVY